METSRYDAHEKPPEHIRKEFKRLQKLKPSELDQDQTILDFHKSTLANSALDIVGTISKEDVLRACLNFEQGENQDGISKEPRDDMRNCIVYEHRLHPGKQ